MRKLQRVPEFLVALASHWRWFMTSTATGTLLLGLGAPLTGLAAPPAAWWTVIGIGGAVGAFLTWNDERTKRAEAEAIVHAGPRVRLLRAEVHGLYLSTDDPADKPADFAWVVNAYFANQPICQAPEAIGRKVVAHLAFFAGDRTTPLLSVPGQQVYGRWTDTPQPPTLGPLAPTRELNAVDFDVNGLHWALDVCVKFQGEYVCRASTNENFLRREFGLALHAHEFFARIRLMGERVDETAWLKVTTNGATRPLVEVVD